MIPDRYRPGWPMTAALVATVLAWPTRAEPLSFESALQLAEHNSPSFQAEQAKVQAASSAAIPAGALPDPKLLLGVQNYPVGGPDRWSLDDDFMTMQMVGVMQEMPNRNKRQARVEVATAAIERAAASQQVTSLKVRLATAEAWISRYFIERKQALFQELFRENRLLADSVHVQIAGGRALAADAVTPKQEALQLAERQDELLRQQAQAVAALRRWVGPAADEPLAGDVPPWPVDRIAYGRKLPDHPELMAYAPMRREAEARVREAEAEKESDWSWELDYQRRGREFGDMVSVQVSFDLPLFAGSRQDPKIAARHAELNQLEAEREARVREYTEQLESDLAAYAQLERAVSRNRDSQVPLARDKVALSTASYRAGTGELSAVVSARRELVEARLRQIDLEAQRALTGARLYFSYGENRP
ncbi:TolC family protein [Pseudomonas sp. MOB-449]|nr:TolC family protein [Pseudomonas sp. MOB-449]